MVEALEWIYTAKLDRKVNGFPNLTLIKKPKRMTKEEFSELEKQEQIELMQESVEIDKSNADVRSNLQNVPRYLEEAKFLLEQDEFFLPHQLDRRGRVYHVPDFGHHNADYIRGMFKFANEKPIGDNIAFLALQIANTYGQDKIALDQRVQWVEDNEEIILLCGETFKHPDAWEFWRKASDPFQFWLLQMSCTSLGSSRQIANNELSASNLPVRERSSVGLNISPHNKILMLHSRRP